MSIDADRVPEAELGADEEAFAESEFFESDDLIPDPPERPSGRIAVHLKKMGSDEPLPAESPWAD